MWLCVFKKIMRYYVINILNLCGIIFYKKRRTKWDL